LKNDLVTFFAYSFKLNINTLLSLLDVEINDDGG
jgi:hypothetical protein